MDVSEQSRATALRILVDYERRDAFLSALLSARLGGSGLDRRDRAFVTELVQGTVRMKLTLDWYLRGFSDRPPAALDAEVAWALRMGAYQVLFMSVPEYAAVDMTVESARAVGGRSRTGYVNAVMRAFVAGRADVRLPDPSREAGVFLEVAYSYPRWVVDMWIEELGRNAAEQVCASGNVQPPLSLRTNLNRIDRNALASRLEARGLSVKEGRMTPECLLVRGSGPIDDLEEFEQGLFSVQDQAAQLVGRQIAAAEGMRILDMCAAPGGKANHIAELSGNRATVHAIDVNGKRLALAARAATRLKNSTVSVREMDATSLTGALEGGYDRVLLDAPCTGLGTLARRPDARWRKEASDVGRLAELQGKLIQEAGRMVRPGGRLVYSTCTISKRENEQVVEAFLGEAADFEPAPVIAEGRAVLPYTRIGPKAAECDGMFVAVLERKGPDRCGT